MKRIIAALVIASFPVRIPCAATRVKELVTLEGVRDNQLIGYGLVVGLAGTGDRRQSIFSAQSLTNMLERMGVSVPAAAIQVKNTAAVMVTANLPPYAQPGAHVDVTVAAMADAASVQGGILLMTGLRAADGQVYAVAQGATVLGGFVAGGAGNGQVVNHPTVGRIPNGAIIERAAPGANLSGVIRLQLRRADFTTASRIVEALNRRFGSAAKAENSALISVSVPKEFQPNPIAFISELERIAIDPDGVERVVINERTGTVVAGKNVQIAPVAIIHGNLTVEVQTTLNVSQPGPVSSGSTQVTPQVSVGVKEQPARNVILQQGASVEELVRALNAIGSTPRDVIAILQNLKSAGALQAEVEIL